MAVAHTSALATPLGNAVAIVPATVARLRTNIAGFRISPLAELLCEGVDKLDERWAAASPDIKGKILDELVTVVVNPAPKGPYFQPEYIEFCWHGPQR